MNNHDPFDLEWRNQGYVKINMIFLSEIFFCIAISSFKTLDDDLFLLKITWIINFRIYDIASISIIRSVSYMIEFYISLCICVCVRFWKFMNAKESRRELQRQFSMIENFRHHLDDKFFPLENIKKQNVF